jgi:hypothetical protein
LQTRSAGVENSMAVGTVSPVAGLYLAVCVGLLTVAMLPVVLEVAFKAVSVGKDDSSVAIELVPLPVAFLNLSFDASSLNGCSSESTPFVVGSQLSVVVAEVFFNLLGLCKMIESDDAFLGQLLKWESSHLSPSGLTGIRFALRVLRAHPQELFEIWMVCYAHPPVL